MTAPRLAFPALVLAAIAGPALAQTRVLRIPNPASELDNTYAIAMCGIADVDGDGIRDVVVGNPGESAFEPYAGAVRVSSGWDGEELHLIRGTQALEILGRGVCDLGDVDGDGRGDFAASWREIDQSAGFRVYSGFTGDVLYELASTDPQQDFTAIANVGDVDGDGHVDVGVPCAQVPQSQPPPVRRS